MPEAAMTIQTVEPSLDDPPPRLSLLPLVSGGLAVALVVAVSLGLWQHADRGSAAPAAAGPAAAVMTEWLSEGTAPRIGGMAKLYREQAIADEAREVRADSQSAATRLVGDTVAPRRAGPAAQSARPEVR
jgi:hypothetical protein